jgi:hypothetical protein
MKTISVGKKRLLLEKVFVEGGDGIGDEDGV